jgi:hypothetical protein
MLNTGAKKVAGCVVSRPKSAVKMVERMSRFQRGSRHFFESADMAADSRKSKAIGKLES